VQTQATIPPTTHVYLWSSLPTSGATLFSGHPRNHEAKNDTTGTNWSNLPASIQTCVLQPDVDHHMQE
jgi:hypothetical protein